MMVCIYFGSLNKLHLIINKEKWLKDILINKTGIWWAVEGDYRQVEDIFIKYNIKHSFKYD